MKRKTTDNQGPKKLFKRFKQNNFLTHNFGLKILALAFSIALWFAVMNISDPEISQPFSGIQVETLNADLVTSEGKVYSVVDNTDTVTVKVTGKRSLVDTLTKDDIHAIADFDDLSFMNTVSIKASSTKYSGQLKLQSLTENLKLEIEDIKRVQLAIETVTEGEPSSGYIVGTVTPDQNIVRISGPQSLVEQIDHVEASVNVKDWKTDINSSYDLKLYDADGNQIKSNSLTQNITSVNVTTTILATKQVKLAYTVSGTPAAGYMATGEITSVPETVTIAGKKSALESLEEISIADTALNVTGQSANMTTIIDVSKYLPSGIQFADSNFNGAASVTVAIEAAETRDFDVPMKNISVINAPDGFTVSMEGAEESDAVYTITLTGLASKIIEMEDANIYGIIDMDEMLKNLEQTEWTEGVYTAPISFRLSDDIIANNIYTVRLHVDKEKDE